MSIVDTHELDTKVQLMYRLVAEQPQQSFHFEMGRRLAARLGYPEPLVDAVPAAAVQSFAGVGYFFDLADLQPGERVLDLGSGSGMDAFVAAHLVGPAGQVVGVDFTPAQLAKARALAAAADAGERVRFVDGRIERLTAADNSFDCVISNGVINLSAAKQAVFNEAARVLRPGGRLAVADIVTERALSESIVCNTDLWASCIGGAAQQETYRQLIESAGLVIIAIRDNDYTFLSEQARGASTRYGVHSISLLARKPEQATAGAPI